MKRKLLSIVLAVCMVVCMMPAMTETAEAATANGGVLSELTTANLNSVFGAGNYTYDGTTQTITLTTNITIADSITIKVPCTIYPKGKIIDRGLTASISPADGTTGNVFIVDVPDNGVANIVSNYGGATIKGGHAATGAGIYIKQGICNVRMKITGNTADYDGGGIYVSSGATLNVGNEISGNIADRDGGGIYVAENGTVTTFVTTYVTGSEQTSSVLIQNNTSGGKGGGVYVGGTFNIKGDTKVQNNKKGEAKNNIYLPIEKTISVVDTLPNSSSPVIYVTTEEPPTTTTPVAIVEGLTTDYSSNFQSDMYAALPSGGTQETHQTYVTYAENVDGQWVTKVKYDLYAPTFNIKLVPQSNSTFDAENSKVYAGNDITYDIILQQNNPYAPSTLSVQSVICSLGYDSLLAYKETSIQSVLTNDASNHKLKIYNGSFSYVKTLENTPKTLGTVTFTVPDEATVKDNGTDNVYTLADISIDAYAFSSVYAEGPSVSMSRYNSSVIPTVSQYAVSVHLQPPTISWFYGEGATDYVTSAGIVGGAIALPVLDSSVIPTGKRLGGWYTAANGAGTLINQGTPLTDEMVNEGAVSLYANWVDIPKSKSSSPSAPAVPVIIDGESYNIGNQKVSGDKTLVTVDKEKLEEQLKKAEESVMIPVQAKTNTVEAQLDVKDVEDISAKNAELIVRSGDVDYSIPPEAIDTEEILKELGTDDGNKAIFSVAVIQTNTKPVVEGATVVVPAIEFKVTAQYNGKTVNVETFNHFVSRTIEITEAQAKQITTAIVYEGDNSFRHVPTDVFKKDGKWFAKINSRTNSTYALIYNEASFMDAQGKWYEEVVTEMASRKVINGRSEDNFAGDANITRAEFAAIVVRALGLPSNGQCGFDDVAKGAWYYGAVGAAYEYDILSGRSAEIFDPMANITRQEAMQMIYNASKVAEFAGQTGQITAFSDAKNVSSWAQAAAEFNVGSGLIVGNDGQLRPEANITRGETATVVLRLLQKAELVDERTKV